MLTLVVLLLGSTLVHSGDLSQTPEDITVKFAEPIDVANQMLYDLDQQIQLIIMGQEPSKSAPGKEPTGLLVYSDSAVKSQIEMLSMQSESSFDVPKEPQDEHNIGSLLSSLGELDKKLQGTFQDLQTRRRFVLGAMIRQMQSTVRRIRSNVVRMQAQLTTIESVATQLPLIRPIVHASNATSPDTTAANLSANKEIIDQIEQRINTVSRRINDIVTRLSSSLTGPGSITHSQPLNPIVKVNSIIHSHRVISQN